MPRDEEIRRGNILRRKRDRERERGGGGGLIGGLCDRGQGRTWRGLEKVTREGPQTEGWTV